MLPDHSYALGVKHEGHVPHQYSSKFYLDQFDLLRASTKKRPPDLININLVKYFIYVKSVAREAVTVVSIWLLPGLDWSLFIYWHRKLVFTVLSLQLAHKIKTLKKEEKDAELK